MHRCYPPCQIRIGRTLRCTNQVPGTGPRLPSDCVASAYFPFWDLNDWPDVSVVPPTRREVGAFCEPPDSHTKSVIRERQQCKSQDSEKPALLFWDRYRRWWWWWWWWRRWWWRRRRVRVLIGRDEVKQRPVIRPHVEHWGRPFDRRVKLAIDCSHASERAASMGSPLTNDAR